METTVCSECLKPKAALACGICNTVLCKKCANFIDEDRFSFLPTIPIELSHGTYCGSCFAEKVTPELSSYDATIERAKDVFVFFKNQGKETRLVKRADKSYRIENCSDRDETILRLAFYAVIEGFNAVVDIDVIYEKSRAGSFKIAKWSGTGTPALIDPNKIRAMR
jgi:hypothetical protein